MAPGEVRRAIERLERSQRDTQKAVDDRVSELARKSVPLELWAAEHRALGEDVKHLKDDVRQDVERLERTSLERLGNLNAQIAALREAQAEHEKAHRENNAWSRSRTWQAIGIAVTALAAIAAAWIGALAAAKGVH